MVGKMPNVTWFEGAFMETIKGWQSGWFYITEPRDPKWAAAPEFRSGIPTRLTSWKETGLSWGSLEEVTVLQTCVQDLVNKKVKLVNVVQAMLFRQILPCQRRAFNLWEFDPAQHQTLSRLFETKHRDAWKVLFQEFRGLPSRHRGSRILRQTSSLRSKFTFNPLRDTRIS